MGDSNQRLGLQEAQAGAVNPFFKARIAQSTDSGLTGLSEIAKDLPSDVSSSVEAMIAPSSEESTSVSAEKTLKIQDWKQFLTTPIEGDGVVYTVIERTKQSMGGATFKMFLEQPGTETRFLMGAMKIKSSRTPNYHIFLDESESSWKDKKYFGKLRMNGSRQYVAYDGGLNPKKGKSRGDSRKQLAAIIFDLEQGTNCPRKITAMVPQEGQSFRPLSDNDGMLDDYMMGKLDNMHILRNKFPKFNEELGCYVLKFKGKGRVTKASAKNFMLIQEDDEDHILLQFGKQSDTRFTCDFRHPFCPLQAFALALSSFDV